LIGIHSRTSTATVGMQSLYEMMVASEEDLERLDEADNKLLKYFTRKDFPTGFKDADTTIAYKFSILTIFGFIISIFFDPLLGIPAQDSVFYINAMGATLCLMFILKELWISGSSDQVSSYLWFLILLFCLPFIYSYTVVRSEYYFLWVINFSLATILLYCILKKEIFFVVWIFGTFLGVMCASILNNYVPAKPPPPYYPFDYGFGIYTTIFLTLVIILIIYNKFYAQKQLLIMVEQEVSDRTKKLKDALDIKREFLDNVSHEIKTPIHNITNITSLLYDQWDILDNIKKKELVATLKSCNSRILNLCSNLLDLSKYKKERTQLMIIEHNIIQLIEEIMQEYGYIQNSISMRISPELHKTVYCDADRILQVLRNLVDNSIKYGKGSAITIEAVNYGTNNVKISVSDNGPGIPEEEIVKVFEPFEQSSRTKTKAGGTGLGLAICKQIIEMHSGSIWAKNNKSGGVTLYFIISNEDS